MKQIRAVITINASAKKAWSVFSDLDKFPAWNPLITRASGELRQGGQLDVYMKPPGPVSRRRISRPQY